MKTAFGHTVECNESGGALVRVNGYCVASFTGWRAGTKGRELAVKIFEALQSIEALSTWGYGPDKIVEFCKDLDQTAAGQLRVKNRIAHLKRELAELEATQQASVE